jgi:sulfur carrier protein
MKVEVKLFATFRNGRWKTKVLSLEDDASIKEVLHLLEIKDEALGIALINGKHSTLESTLRDGDVLALFPPIGGG